MCNNRLSDSDLIKLYKGGDQKAFKQLFDRYQNLVSNIVFPYVKDASTRNDYSQEIWIQVIRKLDKFSEGNFNLWVRTVAKNCCVDRFRSLNRKRCIDQIYIDPSVLNYSDSSEDKYDHESDNQFYEILNKLWGGLEALTETQARVFILRMNGVKYSKISNMLKISTGTCQPAYQTAVLKLRNHLIQNGIAISNKSNFASERSIFKKKKNIIAV